MVRNVTKIYFTRNSCFKITCHTANDKKLNYQLFVQKSFFQHVISSWYSCTITLFLVWRNLPHSSASTPGKKKNSIYWKLWKLLFTFSRNSKRQHNIICSYFATNDKLTNILRSTKLYFHILKTVWCISKTGLTSDQRCS